MLSRLLPKPSHFRALTLISSKLHSYPQPQSQFVSKTPTFTSSFAPRFFSSDRGSNDGENGRNQSDGGVWNLSQDTDGNFEPFFGAENSGNAATMTRLDGGDEWPTAEGYKPWNLAEEERSDLFDIGEVARDDGESEASSLEKQRENEIAKAEEAKRLEKEEQVLTAILKGPNRAFGDLIASSGITDEMIDSLIALKDLEGVAGLPPLAEIEELRYEKSLRKSQRAEIERQKEEEFAKARVRKVDDKGRAYATGRRKCSVARVWIQPGDGKFIINDKDFDVYFPILDHRAALLRPFSDTKTLGLWDVNCTVKGGGTTDEKNHHV
ncbi:28S ribosomal protein S9, mitochondrial isoform X2 [Morus notabilis]|uniref:28S ribosomal protein S9, mitochondrial isoform X2 n=1 Tax=Morus notabilis TaxID=981085 RepID=UPI000CED00C2|nr:28S ribosomal protein S9, mitochondrial isoform X2 [Morus notabilis]